MRKVMAIGVAVLMAATACGDVVDDAATTTSAVEADTPDEPTTGGSSEDTDARGPSKDQSLESGSDESVSIDPSPTTISEERTQEDEELPERVPPTSETPVTGEADSSLVASIKQDLIGGTGASEADITVVRAEEVIWNDGSLGCPKPGKMYSQAVVNGYWVVLEYGGQTYDYRATGTGYFRLCEGFGAPPANPTG